mmetsp:Transcript_82151/g.232602  ORF Transcript_82151/g.232602 Transcript_82151/m.232602 type:complete len:342 (+) Transcript_82151:78-1103(+)
MAALSDAPAEATPPSRPSFALFSPSELGTAVARRASSVSVASRTQEEVAWDLNMRNAAERLAPYRHEMLGGDGAYLEIMQSAAPTGEPGAPEKGTGAALWTAALGLARYLEHRFGPPKAGVRVVAGQRVLELGCGTGLVSLVMGWLGASVVATDIPDCINVHTVPNVDANITRLRGAAADADAEGTPAAIDDNAGGGGSTSGGRAYLGEVEVKELTWGQTPLDEFGNEWDMVVASDVIYRAEHVDLLLQTLQGVIGRTTVGYVAFDRRGREGLQVTWATPLRVGVMDSAHVRILTPLAQAFLKATKRPGSGLTLREVEMDEMPAGYRFVHFGLVELRAVGV